MSFGGVAVDALNPTMTFPAKSLITGLIANALGFDHKDFEKTEDLQQRIVYGVLAKKRGQEIKDYQTVDLGQDFLINTGWTTWGKPIKRKGQNGEGTHIRNRYYLADADYLIALRLDQPDITPNLDDIQKALLKPARPLFIGRKTCLPSCRIFQTHAKADSIEDAFIFFLQNNKENDENREYTIWIPNSNSLGKDLSLETNEQIFSVTDERDWKNQIHSGIRLLLMKNIKIERTIL